MSARPHRPLGRWAEAARSIVRLRLAAVRRLADMDDRIAGTAPAAGPQWGANAADVASILYQKPVLVAVHGREMIKDLPPSGSPWTD